MSRNAPSHFESDESRVGGRRRPTVRTAMNTHRASPGGRVTGTDSGLTASRRWSFLTIAGTLMLFCSGRALRRRFTPSTSSVLLLRDDADRDLRRVCVRPAPDANSGWNAPR
jgi:hypothetical protein